MKARATATGDQVGVTLLELMVALAIFALVATASYSALDQGVAIQERLQDQRRFWQRLDVTFSTVARDLEQAMDRAPRAPGREWSVAFQVPVGGGLDNTLFRFTRGGLTSFREGPASPYERVSYRRAEDGLVRASWPRLDAPPELDAREVVLLEAVTDVRVRVLGTDSERWLEAWPPPASDLATQTEPPVLPRALELTLTFEDHGEFQRIFHVGIPH